MIKILKQLKEERTLAEFHAADSNGRFAVGICLDYDEEYYMLEGISPDGRWDGYSCRLTDDIDMIQVDSKYLNKIKKLTPLFKYIHRDFPVSDKTVLDQMLNYIINGKKICTIETVNDTFLSGKILEVIEGVVKIEVLNSDGQKDGISYIRKEDVGYISVDSEDEVKLDILSK